MVRRKTKSEESKIIRLQGVRKNLRPAKKLDDRSKSFKFVGYAPQGYRNDEENEK